ncbi:MAG: hypothetical protein JST01_26225 [Cyanobacteria bacterium SZAS TMP-1]|nr:hypothetical protein [Cyanobacteria bacterium SZAS TMP-1]
MSNLLQDVDSNTNAKLRELAHAILSNEIDVLDGGRQLYVIALEQSWIDETHFDYLWALRDDVSNLLPSKSDELLLHPDLIARKENEKAEFIEFYRDKVYSTCNYILACP